MRRQALYWRFGPQYAVRQGDWKGVKAAKDAKPMLVNLAIDPGESRDVSGTEPERAAALEALWRKWNAGMLPERWHDPRSEGAEARQRLLETRAKGAKKKRG